MKERNIITMEGKSVTLTGRNVWMTSWEIAGLFGVTAAMVNNALRKLLKEGALKEHEACRYVRLENGYHADVFSLEAVIALSFRFDTCHTALFRRWLSGRLLSEKKSVSFICITGGNGIFH